MGENSLYLDERGLEEAVSILREGGLVAIPTETVYGLAADSKNEAAVARIYQAKGRPSDKPLSVLVTGMDMVEDVCREIPPLAYRLAEVFWPGPSTISEPPDMNCQ